MPSGLGMRPMSLLTLSARVSRKARLESEDQIHLIERDPLDQMNLIFATSPLPGRRPKELLAKLINLLSSLASVARMRSLYYYYIIDFLDGANQVETQVLHFSYFLLERPTGAITREGGACDDRTMTSADARELASVD